MTYKLYVRILYSVLAIFIIFTVTITYCSRKIMKDSYTEYITRMRSNQIGYCILERENVPGTYIIVTEKGVEIIEGEKQANEIIYRLKEKKIYGKNYREFLNERKLFQK